MFSIHPDEACATTNAALTSVPALVNVAHDVCTTFFIQTTTPHPAAANTYVNSRLKQVWQCLVETPAMARTRLGCAGTTDCPDATLFLRVGGGACGQATCSAAGDGESDCNCAAAKADLDKVLF